MITAVVTNPAGELVYNVSFGGTEFALGMILGALAAVVVWSTLKSFGRS